MSDEDRYIESMQPGEAGLRAWLARQGAKGGKKSRRKLTKKQAREMVKARERKRAAGVALKPREHDGARSTTASDQLPPK